MKKLMSIVFIFGLSLAWGCKLEKNTIMVPNTGKVCLKVEATDSEIYLDDKYLGKANEFKQEPDCLELSAGRHHLKISHPDFEPYTQELYVGESATQWVSVKLNSGKPK